mmetsp:Transcript_37567/g.52964  ORF Transcript_37567/g.52964 Transcript_37567/m.52964 type:complete len:87 (-) Transcript_37567:392-652(-)
MIVFLLLFFRKKAELNSSFMYLLLPSLADCQVSVLSGYVECHDVIPPCLYLVGMLLVCHLIGSFERLLSGYGASITDTTLLYRGGS